MRSHVGLVLHPCRHPVFCGLLGLRQGLRLALEGVDVDYTIAGVAAVFLFGYLIYALLRPERF